MLSVLSRRVAIRASAVASRGVKNIAVDDKEKLSKPRSQIKGTELLRNPAYFKGMAFTMEERQLLGIQGLIPPAVLSQDVQVLRIMTNFRREQSDLDRYIDLINLQDRCSIELQLDHFIRSSTFSLGLGTRNSSIKFSSITSSCSCPLSTLPQSAWRVRSTALRFVGPGRAALSTTT